MPHGIKGWAIFAVAQTCLTIVVHWLTKLADNAMLTWVDDQIAMFLGFSQPRAATVISWGIAAFVVFLMLFLYHVAQSRISTAVLRKPIKGTFAPDAPPYLTAYEAIHHIADQSAWGKGIRESTSTPNNAHHGNGIQMRKIPILEAFPEFSRGAQESKIDVLGRLGGNGSHVRIPYTDWLTIGIDHNTLVRRQTSQTTSIKPTGTVPFYTDLQIRRDDVYRVWPPNDALKK
jgi:hypothetical protein